jgi:hypothetical protein
MSLESIETQENVSKATLSSWKNDDREEFGGLWQKGCKADNVNKAKEQLQKELEATSVYDEMSKRLEGYYGVDKDGKLDIDGAINLASDNAKLQAKVETDVTLLGAVQADYFDAQLFKNSMLSSIVLNNQVKKDITKVKQTDIKMSSDIHKMAKEARFGKSPDTVIFNANGDYNTEDLKDLSIEELEKLYMAHEQKAIEVLPKKDTQKDTQ